MCSLCYQQSGIRDALSLFCDTSEPQCLSLRNRVFALQVFSHASDWSGCRKQRREDRANLMDLKHSSSSVRVVYTYPTRWQILPNPPKTDPLITGTLHSEQFVSCWRTEVFFISLLKIRPASLSASWGLCWGGLKAFLGKEAKRGSIEKGSPQV